MPSSSAESSAKSGLSGGTIGGIVAGSVIGAIAIVGIVAFAWANVRRLEIVHDGADIPNPQYEDTSRSKSS